ncbi:hypothetical protein M422DRAFT_259602 [Sphaerobolus stellatus SS14]|uniref:Unplaced genomic scaffold SPHSTscaffold_91, whole genome shotgun sequence n=1 Tax=Sphaerobolus stellatus (strain SS14) TaxID=990650 RepID=A0A0C9USH1_SPHS4|nr:hypothetical protein M422DRAFT_259602 [Sphaerobolus stellatus SS14]
MDLTPRRQCCSDLGDPAFDESDSELHPFHGAYQQPIKLRHHIALPSSIPSPSITSLSLPRLFPNSMASKFIPEFHGPLTASSLTAWLGQCDDGFAIYSAMKTDKSPDLNVMTKIRLTGSQLKESTAAAWWTAGRKEFLTTMTYETFVKKLEGRFMPKGYKLVALRTLFLCSQGRSQFSDYAAALVEAHNALSEKVINANLYKYHLLFHSHTLLLLRILVLPNLNISDMAFDDLASLMSMQWESFIAESAGHNICAAPASASTSMPPAINSTAPAARNGLPPLTNTERKTLSAAGGCWECVVDGYHLAPQQRRSDRSTSVVTQTKDSKRTRREQTPDSLPHRFAGAHYTNR